MLVGRLKIIQVLSLSTWTLYPFFSPNFDFPPIVFDFAPKISCTSPRDFSA